MPTYALLGRSLAHSFSRGYFAEKFAALGLRDHHYVNLEVPTAEEIAAALRGVPDLRGFNVTIPYKRAVVTLLASLGAAAAEIGAVNVVRVAGDGTLHGHNTDWLGFADSLALVDREDLRNTDALVLGTGGASAAVAYALREAGFAVRLVSRRPAGGQFGYEALDGLDWSAPRLIVNTTPVGTAPDAEAMPRVPVNELGRQHAVVDLIYNPAETRLLREARLRGAQTANGLPMLHGQAEAAWAIWSADDGRAAV